jgi:hypothetical protein
MEHLLVFVHTILGSVALSKYIHFCHCLCILEPISKLPNVHPCSAVFEPPRFALYFCHHIPLVHLASI